MAGLLLGLVLAFCRERFDRRLRTVTDVRDRGRMNVLAALDDRTAPRFDDVLQPYGPGGRIFNRLRNEVLASLNPGDQIIVVTGASRGAATTLVAANLAAALARTGSDVVLVGAHLPDSVVDARAAGPDPRRLPHARPVRPAGRTGRRWPARCSGPRASRRCG